MSNRPEFKITLCAASALSITRLGTPSGKASFFNGYSGIAKLLAGFDQAMSVP